jgi:hypothetical protein
VTASLANAAPLRGVCPPKGQYGSLKAHHEPDDRAAAVLFSLAVLERKASQPTFDGPRIAASPARDNALSEDLGDDQPAEAFFSLRGKKERPAPIVGG